MKKHLNWKGLLIEANPVNYELVLKKNRLNTTSFVAAAGDCPGGAINFTGDSAMGHLVDEKINSFLQAGNKPMMQVPCLPLGSLLKQAGLQEIDYFILDVEGAEYSALKTLDWSIPVKVWIVEMNHSPNEPIIDIFAEHGYYDSGINFVEECRQLLRNFDKDVFAKRIHSCTPGIIFVKKQG